MEKYDFKNVIIIIIPCQTKCSFLILQPFKIIYQYNFKFR